MHLFFVCNSSLLIVYEGYEEAPLEKPLIDNRTLVKSHSDDVTIKAIEEDSRSGGNCSYDADASDDSIELNLSLHEESEYRKTDNALQQSQHQRQRQQQQRHQHTMSYSNHLTNTSEMRVVNSSTTTTIEVTSDPREASTRGTTPFIPISEETIFLDADHIDPVTSSGISTMSSPMSCDSWMNYSSNSSDDLSCISDRIHVQQPDSSEESSLEFDAPLSNAQSTPKTKRMFNKALLTVNNDDGNGDGAACSTPLPSLESSVLHRKAMPYTVAPTKLTQLESASDDFNLASAPSSLPLNAKVDDDLSSGSGQTKRLRGKSGKSGGNGTVAVAPPSSSGSIKRKAVNRANSISGAICDIRMIDFAHTTFVRKNGDIQLPAPAATVQHEGPDNGFLRGIESLKRLLNEILDDNECNK